MRSSSRGRCFSDMVSTLSGILTVAQRALCSLTRVQAQGVPEGDTNGVGSDDCGAVGFTRIR
jgi:hypothetical protein